MVLHKPYESFLSSRFQHLQKANQLYGYISNCLIPAAHSPSVDLVAHRYHVSQAESNGFNPWEETPTLALNGAASS